MDKHIDENSITIINGVYEFLVTKKSSRTQKKIYVLAWQGRAIIIEIKITYS